MISNILFTSHQRVLWPKLFFFLMNSCWNLVLLLCQAAYLVDLHPFPCTILSQAETPSQSWQKCSLRVFRGESRGWHYCHWHILPVKIGCIMQAFLMRLFIGLACRRRSLKGKRLGRNEKRPYIDSWFCFRLKGPLSICVCSLKFSQLFKNVGNTLLPALLSVLTAVQLCFPGLCVLVENTRCGVACSLYTISV